MMRIAKMSTMIGTTNVVLNMIPSVNERIHKIAAMRMRTPMIIPTIAFP